MIMVSLITEPATDAKKLPPFFGGRGTLLHPVPVPPGRDEAIFTTTRQGFMTCKNKSGGNGGH